MDSKIIKYKNPMIFLTAPSGSGKDTIMKLLKQNASFNYPPSITSRPKRPSDEGNFAYRFVSKEKFEEMIENNEFIEYDEHFGNYYGSEIDSVLTEIQKNIALKQVDINGLIKLKSTSSLKYDKNNHTMLLKDKYLIQVYFIGLIMESIEITKKCIINRDEINEDTNKRIARMEKEYNYVTQEGNVDFLVINRYNKQNDCANEIIEKINKIIKT